LAPIRGIPTKGGGLKVCICGSETCIVNFTCLISEWMFDLWLFKPFLDLFSFSLLFRIGSPSFLQLYLIWTCVVLRNFFFRIAAYKSPAYSLVSTEVLLIPFGPWSFSP
jgi:hypothetical protein